MKRRVDALKKIQLDYIQIQNQYHREVQELELKYEKLYQPLYEKRYKITSGEHEPTDEDCQLPESVIDPDFGDDQENEVVAEDDEVITFTEEEDKALQTKVKGIPGFWMGCLTSTYNFNDSIEAHDRAVLKHLVDVRLSYGEAIDDTISYKLEFLFEDNPHFTNKVLTKTYYLKQKPDEKDPFSYEGFEIFKSEGCEINWNPGKDVTITTKTVKQKNKNDGRIREKKKEVEDDSFFYFFKPPQLPPGGFDELDEDLGALVSLDFELGETIRLSILPKSVLYFTGYMFEEDDDDDDDAALEFGEDDDDDDDDDDDSDDSDSDESHDSLNNTGGKDKKKLIAKKGSKSPGKSS